MTFSLPRLFLILLVVHAGWVIFNPHYPSTDVFLFKEAGVNLASKGRFVASNLPHLPPDQEIVFAYYPPVYPFLYGAWSSLFGVGLHQSSLFDALLKILRTMLLLALAAPVLRRNRDPRVVGAAIACLVLASLVSSDGDRPDELAIVGGLSAWWFLRGQVNWRNLLASGAALGITGATSPAAAVFFGLGIFIAQGFVRSAIVGVTSAITFALCNLPIYLSDPQAYSRFSKQLPLSTFPYLAIIREGQPLYAGWRVFKEFCEQSYQVARPYVFCLAVLTVLVGYLWWRSSTERRRQLRPFVVTALLFLPIWVIIWTLQPYYLWFSCVALLGAALIGVSEMHGRAGHIAVAIICLAFAPLLLREAKGFINTVQQLPADSADQAQAEVAKYVGPQAKLAITSDQYFTFRGVREVANIDYVCYRLNEFDYVYVTRYTSTSRAQPDPIPIPCEENAACFSVEKDFSTRKVLKIFGHETPYYVRGSAGVLYKNTHCKG